MKLLRNGLCPRLQSFAAHILAVTQPIALRVKLHDLAFHTPAFNRIVSWLKLSMTIL